MIKVILTIVFCATTGIINGQVIADFESPAQTPALSPTGVIAVPNPDQEGNTSENVVLFNKPSQDWQAVYFTFSSKINIGKNDRLTFKLRSSSLGRVYVKVVNGSTVILENWAPEYNFMPSAGKWTECTMDLSSLEDQQFDQLQVNASVNNSAAATVYLDDFKLTNSFSPNGEPIIEASLSSNTIAEGDAVNFDASTSYDADGGITSLTWNFGDGDISTAPTVSHVYSSRGIYQASLKIEDNDSKSSVKIFLIYVLPSGGKISELLFLTSDPVTFGKVEAAFAVKGSYSNVYDPDEVSIDAVVTMPDNSEITVPCFYYQKSYYIAETDKWIRDENESYWMVRFSSPQTGIHKIAIKLTDAEGTTISSEGSIEISASQQKGYIKMDPQNKQYYRHSTGDPYYPLGINIGWGTTTRYHTIMTNLRDGHANLIRYWQAPFDRQGLEWKNGSGFYQGLGAYSPEAAAEQDSILKFCESNGMFLQMCIFQHGMFSQNVDSNWGDNPLNTANGGPLSTPEQFFYNDEAKAYTKKLLRYIVARWGYSTSLFAWELFNEVQFTGNHPNQSSTWRSAVPTWHDEMGQHIKSLDAFDHLVTTSIDDGRIVTMNNLPGLDNVQYHLYDANLLSTQIARDKTLLSGMTKAGLVNGEYGTTTNADVPFDVQRVAVWTGIMTQVPHLMWLWDNYDDPAWGELVKTPADFVKDEDFVGDGVLSDWSFTAKTGSKNLTSAGFSSNKNFYAVVYDPGNGDNIMNAECDVSKLPAAKYAISYYNTITGVVTTEEKNIYGGSRLILPSFSKAIALKIKYLSEADPVTEVERDFKNAIRVYPNPATKKIWIDVGDVNYPIQAALLDARGRKIIAGSILTNSTDDGIRVLDLEKYNVKQGLYFLYLRGGSLSCVRKIVIQNY
ncbi:MAG TPA: PKD domain-containing protein [Cyclobacteriaceae bacterium]|nr:PKD domain-containing protein [Cyclobacteriaceae bacterium]